MANASTTAVWRSFGGDQTRTAAAGSMVMAVPFYVANAGASGNVTVSSTDASPVILPAGARVISVTLTTTGTSGAVDIGYTPLVGAVGPGQSPSLGTPVPAAFGDNVVINAAATLVVGEANAGASLGTVANATNLIVVTTTNAATGVGAYGGFITYTVA